MEKNEIISLFARKGFLLDKDCLDFFIALGNVNVSEEILNRILILTKSRVVSKNILNEHFKELETYFRAFEKDKDILIDNFFARGKIEEKELGKPKSDQIKESTEEIKDVKIISSEIIPYKRIEVKDFVTHFKNRYNLFKNLFLDRKELTNLVSLNKIGNNRSFSVIGLVANKRITKNKNIILEIEDPSGKKNVLVNHDREEIMAKANEVVPDDVIGLKCSAGGEFVYVNDIFFADSFVVEKKKSESEIYALFISDIHVGSKLFLKDKFLKFIDWLNGRNVDEVTKEKIEKIKYLFVVGDNVDGVGIYPGQETLLEIKDLVDQYKQLANYFKMIPSKIRIIMCPGQHDAVRVPEPQPAIGKDFAQDLCEMKNVFLVSNPSMLEIDCDDKKKGIKVLMYHGASMIRNWMDEIESLRLSKAHSNPTKIAKYMLRHRHLSPSHSSNVYVPSEKDDPLMIKEVPDIMVTGDLHKADVDLYNNILVISGSCWQSMTPFEEKVGNLPDPAKVPMINLKTREVKILDFN